jgi:hypothetical protein
MKSRWIVAFAVALAGVAVYVGNVLATTQTPPPGFAGKTLATATFGEIDSHVQSEPTWQEKIKTKGLSDLYVQQNTFDPSPPPTGCGCTPSTGWHTHPGPSLVIVTQGTVAVYEGDDPTCTPHVYTAGTTNNSFLDIGGGDVHLIRDESGAPAQTIAVQLIPAGSTRRIDEDNPYPGTCPN